MKIILVMVSLMFMMGCAIADIATDSYYSETLIHKTDIYYPLNYSIKKTNSTEDIINWISDNIEYSLDYANEWRSVEEILESGKGDCKSFVMLFLNLYYITFGVECEMVLVDGNRSIGEGGRVNHSVVSLDNTLIEPQNGEIVSYPIGYYYSFTELFN